MRHRPFFCGIDNFFKTNNLEPKSFVKKGVIRMRQVPIYFGIEYAKNCNPWWAENPKLYAIITGFNAWGIDAKWRGCGSEGNSFCFGIPFRYGAALQMAVAAWNRSIEEPGLEERDPLTVISGTRHYVYPVSFFGGDKQKSAMTMVEFGNFLLSLGKDFNWLPEELFRDELIDDLI